jgi:hypothetical protein
MPIVIQFLSPGDEPRRAQHTQDACRESQKQEHDQAPRRTPEQRVETPSDSGADHNTGNEISAKPERRTEARAAG